MKKWSSAEIESLDIEMTANGSGSWDKETKNGTYGSKINELLDDPSENIRVDLNS